MGDGEGLVRRHRRYLTPTFDVRLSVHSDESVSNCVAAHGYDLTRDIWDTMTGRKEAETTLALELWLSCPTSLVSVMRRGGGVPASTLLGIVAELKPSQVKYAHSAVDTIWRRIEELAAVAETIANGFGWSLGKSWETTRAVESRKVSADIERIARLAGQMYETMNGVRRRVADARPNEVKGVTIGGDLTFLLASEKAQLSANGPTAEMATMRLLQGKSAQLRVAGDKLVGRGPLCICIDESGSMSDRCWSPLVGTYDDKATGRNTWAKACMVALTRIAHEDNRMVHVVHFGESTRADRVAPGDNKALLEATTCFLGGGTDIGGALSASIDELRQMRMENPDSHGDVVVITDGQDGYAGRVETAIADIKAESARLWSVGIVVDFPTQHPLRKHAEEYVHVSGQMETKGVGSLTSAAMGDRLR